MIGSAGVGLLMWVVIFVICRKQPPPAKTGKDWEQDTPWVLDLEDDV